jgi:CubicO group peptidase (beta-lactamase class C family)
VADEAAFAETAELGAAPGTRWSYTNGNTMLLARMIRDQAGGDAISVLRFAHRELFDKLGMEHVTLEFDGVGTPIGSSHMWASARDWARFGQLYLDDGVVGGEHSARGLGRLFGAAHPGSETYGYGAGFRTNLYDRRGGQAHRAGHAARISTGSPGWLRMRLPAERPATGRGQLGKTSIYAVRFCFSLAVQGRRADLRGNIMCNAHRSRQRFL